MDASDRDTSALMLLDPGRPAALLALAVARRHEPGELLNDAVGAYLDTDRWQHAEIEAALKEAQAGDFADDDGVASTSRPGEAAVHPPLSPPSRRGARL